MASSWVEDRASNVIHTPLLVVVDARTGNEILLSVEGVASPSESVSFLYPVLASPWVRNQICCILMTALEIWEEWR